MTDRNHGEEKYLPREHREGRALCLSGGGFRAALFHAGVLRRLNELGILSRIDTFTSVSGGSIALGMLASRWNRLEPDDHGVLQGLEEHVLAPLREFCASDLRTDVFLSRFAPGNWFRLAGRGESITNVLAERYLELGLTPTLAELGTAPRFVFCTANLETGASWTFGPDPESGEPVMGDYRTGYRSAADITVATAVAASSAHPYIFPPLVLDDLGDEWQGGDGSVTGAARHCVALGDGGIYDNMGLEPVWKSHACVLVSDAGAPFRFEDDPRVNIFDRLVRSYTIVESQALGMRKRWLINGFQSHVMTGTYWGIGTDHRHYELSDSQGFSGEALLRLGDVRTDLDAFSEEEVAGLGNHGYALADVAIRKWVPELLPTEVPAFRWPHPELSDPARVAAALADSHRRGILEDLRRWATGRITNVLADESSGLFEN